jgi:hypothetical protein
MLNSKGSQPPRFRANYPNRWLFALACTAIARWGSGCETAPSNSPAPPTGDFAAAPEAQTDAVGQAFREIEEADIIKVVGNKVYVLNRFKGLIIIDVTNPNAPGIMGELDLLGRGVEMYVVGSQVFAILSADYYVAYAEPGGVIADVGPPPPPPDFNGSQLAIIDVSDPAHPQVDGKINLVGYANASRRVGNVIYVVGEEFISYGSDQPVSSSDPQTGFVASVNVADPANIVPVQRETFSGRSLAIHVSQTTIFAASHEYDPDSASFTRLQAIDISDPAGAIAMRGSVDVPGFIRNRFFMDDFEGVLRIATESDGFGFRQVRVYTYDLADLDAITALGQVDVIEGESLEAARFDGPRGYVVTFLRVDPLFVIDLREPANPAVSGHLVVPGFSTHLEPRETRLIAVGVDDTDGRRPAVAYYDVTDPAAPSELGRVVLGPPGSYTDSDAIYDEKAFKIIDELGLIAIPFHHFEGGGGTPVPVPLGGGEPAAAESSNVPKCTNGVQLVDFSDTALTRRGIFEHRGRVERVGALSGRLFALSQAGFQTVHIDDRDNPAKAGQADFFSGEDMSYYADDCGGYWGPIDLVVNEDPWGDFLSTFFGGGLCGALGLLPLTIVPGTLLVWKRKRSKSNRYR